jgi:hypothetical protein
LSVFLALWIVVQSQSRTPNVIRRPGHSGVRGDSPVNQPWREQYVLTGHGTGAVAGDKAVSARRSPASLCARKESRREERVRERERPARLPSRALTTPTHAQFASTTAATSDPRSKETRSISFLSIVSVVALPGPKHPTVFVFLFLRSPPPLLFRIKSCTLLLLLLLQNKVLPRSFARNTKPDSLYLGTYLLLHWSPTSPSS